MRLLKLFAFTLLVAGLFSRQAFADTVELLTGKTLQGTIKSYRGTDVIVEIKVGARSFQQKYPKSRVHAITIGTKRIELKKPNKPNQSHFNRDQARARASIAAIKFYTLDPKKVKDGSYRASSIGYEGQVEIEVTVKSGSITNVKVTSRRRRLGIE